MYVERPPGADLVDRVACVWWQVSEAGATQLVVPDACVDLIWGPEGLFVAGPDTGPMPARMAPGDTFTGIRFRPGAVGDFFGVPLQELRDRRVPLSDLPFARGDALLARRPARGGEASHQWVSSGALASSRPEAGAPPFPHTSAGHLLSTGDETRLASGGEPPYRLATDEEELYRLVSGDEESYQLISGDEASFQISPGGELPFDRALRLRRRLRVMRAAVRKRLAQGVRVDPATSAIARELRHGRTVGEVAWDLGFSERQLHRRSVSSFGYAPKTLQRIVRFQHALRLARAGVPLAEVAVTSGYADQAHLSHDVKRLSGVSMRDLVSLASG
ncbi:helix-turn-helix transcriptional regulator [Nonomuraea phyllanthi]|nr:helix-turn-helix transcriptional regulator [Nonomuraea phyllanthi]